MCAAQPARNRFFKIEKAATAYADPIRAEAGLATSEVRVDEHCSQVWLARPLQGRAAATAAGRRAGPATGRVAHRHTGAPRARDAKQASRLHIQVDRGMRYCAVGHRAVGRSVDATAASRGAAGSARVLLPVRVPAEKAHGHCLIFCECANAARMTKSTLAAKYKSLMVQVAQERRRLRGHACEKECATLDSPVSRSSVTGPPRRRLRLPRLEYPPLNSRGRAQRLVPSRCGAGGSAVRAPRGDFTVTVWPAHRTESGSA